MADYQWYPGHMTKARRMMQEAIRSVDMVVELADARVPLASRNPDIGTLAENKKRLLVLNKEDLADPARTKAWLQYFRDRGEYAIPFNAKKNSGGEKVTDAMRKLLADRTRRDREKGIRPVVSAMIAGIPNVGKSALINCLAKRALTKTANRPGVTRGKQWISLAGDVRLLDTPGILWPKFEDQTVGMRLAVIGSMNDVNLDLQTLALELVRALNRDYNGIIESTYGFTAEEVRNLAEEERLTGGDAAVIGMVAKKRGCVMRGGVPDYDKASAVLLTDFRGGRLGRLTLEMPETAGE